MTCHRIAGGIVCTPRRPASPCACGRTQHHTMLCDWPDPSRRSKTCDRKLCEHCARHEGEFDYCRSHVGSPPLPKPKRHRPAQLALVGILALAGCEHYAAAAVSPNGLLYLVTNRGNAQTGSVYGCVPVNGELHCSELRTRGLP